MAPLPEQPAESHTAPEPAPAVVAAAEAERWRDKDMDALRSRGLQVPVDGVDPSRIQDTFLSARDGKRVHNAVDIMAKKGTPVLSADDGTIIRIGTNGLGGNVIWAVDSNQRFVLYYAHLDRFRPGLREGQPVQRGEVIGYVGTTGNAPKDAPHLHFQLMRLLDNKRYSEGPAVNPLPLFFRLSGSLY